MLHTYMRGIAARRTRLYLIKSAIVFAAIALTACKDIGGPQESSVAGSYALADVGGNRLPATVYEGPLTVNGQRLNVKMAVQNGTLQLTEDRYQMQVAITAAVLGQDVPLPITDTGSFTKNGSQFVFTSNDPKIGVFPVTITSNAVALKIDVSGDGHPPTYQFRK